MLLAAGNRPYVMPLRNSIVLHCLKIKYKHNFKYTVWFIVATVLNSTTIVLAASIGSGKLCGFIRIAWFLGVICSKLIEEKYGRNISRQLSNT
jgi:hypothetical protein